ncbi:MAG: GNAT family N-acetyltransferase [Pseudobdellovibrio sp.]
MFSIDSVKFIKPDQCLDLRTRILRPGQDIKLCVFPEDTLPTTFHLGIADDCKIICNGTFMQNSHPDFSVATNPYRLRGMATDTAYQGQNLGSLLLQKAEHILRHNYHCDFLWFNARESAFPFYQKNKFNFHREMFDIPQVGPHKVMYKWL